MVEVIRPFSLGFLSLVGHTCGTFLHWISPISVRQGFHAIVTFPCWLLLLFLLLFVSRLLSCRNPIVADETRLSKCTVKRSLGGKTSEITALDLHRTLAHTFQQFSKAAW